MISAASAVCHEIDSSSSISRMRSKGVDEDGLVGAEALPETTEGNDGTLVTTAMRYCHKH